MSEFRFELTGTEKAYLKNLVRSSIAAGLQGKPLGQLPEPPSPKLAEELGAFVTLKLGGQLRGCIGNVVGSGPLHRTIADMAQAAAFQDPRFPPLSADEADTVGVEISVLSPITECADTGAIQVGRHGLIIQRGPQQGLLLPQVATEWDWDAPTFLDHTCQKAGLPMGCWREADTRVLWFEAEIF